MLLRLSSRVSGDQKGTLNGVPWPRAGARIPWQNVPADLVPAWDLAMPQASTFIEPAERLAVRICRATNAVDTNDARSIPTKPLPTSQWRVCVGPLSHR